MQDDPRSAGRSRSRQVVLSTGPRAHTHEATRTGPAAERITTTRCTLRRGERVTVQGPVRKPTKAEMSHRRLRVQQLVPLSNGPGCS